MCPLYSRAVTSLKRNSPNWETTFFQTKCIGTFALLGSRQKDRRGVCRCLQPRILFVRLIKYESVFSIIGVKNDGAYGGCFVLSHGEAAHAVSTCLIFLQITM